MSIRVKLLLPFLAGMLLLLSAGRHANAVEFKSVGVAAGVLVDAPSERGRKLFLVPRGMPLEVVLVYGEWSKVRDSSGELAWIDSKSLLPKRSLMVSAPLARVRAAAEDAAPLVFAAERGVLLEWVEPASSAWVKVRHRDGQTGFVRAADVWGD